MILETDINTRDTNQIGLEMLYQEEITYYVNRSIDMKQNLRKAYTVIWELWNKQFQNLIETNI